MLLWFLSTTAACGAWPSTASATAKVATSATSGCSRSTVSTCIKRICKMKAACWRDSVGYPVQSRDQRLATYLFIYLFESCTRVLDPGKTRLQICLDRQADAPTRQTRTQATASQTSFECSQQLSQNAVDELAHRGQPEVARQDAHEVEYDGHIASSHASTWLEGSRLPIASSLLASSGENLRPPQLMISLVRPVTVRKPSPSTNPASLVRNHPSVVHTAPRGCETP